MEIGGSFFRIVSNAIRPQVFHQPFMVRSSISQASRLLQSDFFNIQVGCPTPSSEAVSKGELMRASPKVEKWVVYETTAGPNTGRKSVCTTGEWNCIESSKSNENRIIMDGIPNENDAEKLARGTSGDQKPRQTKPRPAFE